MNRQELDQMIAADEAVKRFEWAHLHGYLCDMKKYMTKDVLLAVYCDGFRAGHAAGYRDGHRQGNQSSHISTPPESQQKADSGHTATECPQCGANLQVWREMLHEEHRCY